MTLSEAILLGSTLAPQGFGSYSTFVNGERRICAMKGAIDAFGDERSLVNHCRDVLNKRTRCPVCMGSGEYLSLVVIHLNDIHEWTRERIAAWVATMEAPQPVAVPDEELMAV